MRTFFLFLTFMILITYFINGFTSSMNFQLIAYLPNPSEHKYWILDLEGEVHSTWVLWTRQPSIMQGQLFLEVEWGGQCFQSCSKTIVEGCLRVVITWPGLILAKTPPPKVCRVGFNP